jgi:hypothetical protein
VGKQMKNKLLQVTKLLTDVELLLTTMLLLTIITVGLSVILDSQYVFAVGCGAMGGLWIMAIANRLMREDAVKMIRTWLEKLLGNSRV